MSGAAFEFPLWMSALPVMLVAATLTWGLSLPLRNVGIVDVLWSLLLFAAGVVYALGSDPRSPRLSPVLWLLAIWAARHAWQRVARAAGRGEPARYAQARGDQPRYFWLTSLFRVFWARAFCAWLVSLPLLGAFATIRPWGLIDDAAVVLWLAGFGWQLAADWQLRRFKTGPAAGGIVDRGPWRFSRHPRHFGEWLIWWGFTGFALAAGAWWALAGITLLSGLLMRASGARPFGRERAPGGGNGRPDNADYVLKTNAFFPGPPRN